jgi:signal transduction histidine kinase
MSIPRDENSMKPRPRSFTSEGRIKLLLILMVIVGYVVNFIFISAQDGRRLTPAELFWGISFGVLYLLLGLKASVIFDRVPAGWAEAGFFSVQCALLFGIGLLLETRGTWLIGVPLVGFAVEKLAGRQRWAVYVVLCASLVLPLGLRYSNWASTLLSSVTVGTAIVFVAVFAQMRLNEQQARERAEQLMAELEKANVQLAAYATQAEELAMTQERNRLAREIHDNLGHTLTIVNVQLEAARVVMESDPGRALDAMNKAQDLVHKGLTGVRESVAALRGSPVRNRPLGEAIVSLVRETQSSGIITEFEVTGKPLALEHKVALALYRAAQEGLTNVRRHARASRVDVRLDFQPGKVRLEIRDNGVGAMETNGGFGLLGIRERMQLLGGTLEIQTGAGKGFRLIATVPLADAVNPVPPEG